MSRLVLDTNVWLDWLVFDDPGIASIRKAYAGQCAEIFIDAACEAELIRVLAYPFGRHTIDAAAQAAAIGECRRIATFIELRTTEQDRSLPTCRDPDDQKFLQAALAAGADILVTRDQALLELAGRRVRPVPFRIMTPEVF